MKTSLRELSVDMVFIRVSARNHAKLLTRTYFESVLLFTDLYNDEGKNLGHPIMNRLE